MTSAGEAPVGQLGDSVVPNHYRLELRIDPRQDSFSGLTEIYVTFSEPRDQVWLHGKNLRIEEAWLSNSASERVEATWEEKLDSGVALLTLASPVGAGNATLHFKYSAPFNTTANALFKVMRDEDSYAATQFQPIAARQVFRALMSRASRYLSTWPWSRTLMMWRSLLPLRNPSRAWMMASFATRLKPPGHCPLTCWLLQSGPMTWWTMAQFPRTTSATAKWPCAEWSPAAWVNG